MEKKHSKNYSDVQTNRKKLTTDLKAAAISVVVLIVLMLVVYVVGNIKDEKISEAAVNLLGTISSLFIAGHLFGWLRNKIGGDLYDDDDNDADDDNEDSADD